jgi:ribonuclease E
MTPEEQDVYAWMGISPLVLSLTEVKNPKSALISVVLPGQTSAESVPAVIDLFAEPTLDEPIQSTDQDDPAIPGLETAQPADDAFAQEGVEQESADNGVARRRRRRSSATATD